MAAAVSVDKPFFDAQLAEGNALWPAMMRCNAHPCPAKQEAAGPLSPDALASLRTWLAQIPDSGRDGELPEDAVFFWDFGEDSRKLFLLDDGELERLADVAGVTLHAPALARIVAREERRICREALGAELFDYAQSRGQYRTGAAGDIVARRDKELPLPERCRAHGWLALYFCSLRWPKELRRVFLHRLARLSGEIGTTVSLGNGLSDTAWQALWRMLKKCLLGEVAPSWKPYFTA